MDLAEVIAVFGRREKCYARTSGHNSDAKYVVSKGSTYVTSCGDHLTRAIRLVLHDAGNNGSLDVTVWVKP